VFEGGFKDGDLHGYGVLKDRSGQVIVRGTWRDGEFVG
jgi:hypothetical protein